MGGMGGVDGKKSRLGLEKGWYWWHQHSQES